MAKKQPCIRCKWRPKWSGKQRCAWCWLREQPIGIQEAAAARRLHRAMEAPGYVARARVPASEWPTGHRWCAGCQSYVPDDYVRGSRCIACASQAAHASHVRRTYGIDPDVYRELLAWQQGRCFVCGQVPRSQRLAVDHDHETGAVRGLLCANDQWGCNVSLRRILDDVDAAERLALYARRSPLERMKAGETAPQLEPKKRWHWLYNDDDPLRV